MKKNDSDLKKSTRDFNEIAIPSISFDVEATSSGALAISWVFSFIRDEVFSISSVVGRCSSVEVEILSVLTRISFTLSLMFWLTVSSSDMPSESSLIMVLILSTPLIIMPIFSLVSDTDRSTIGGMAPVEFRIAQKKLQKSD